MSVQGTMVDKQLKCMDCGATFVWTTGEQEFYAEQRFSHEPKRCKECRQAKKRARDRQP